MTPKIIELKQAPVVLVEKPNEDDNDLVVVSGKEIFYNGDYFELPKADFHNPWKVLGILSDLTEDQFAECVTRPVKWIYKDKSSLTYPNFNTDISKNTDSFKNAKQSFYSLLESEKVYMENPYARPSYHDADRNYWMLEDKWQEAQSRTIDLTRTIILLKK